MSLLMSLNGMGKSGMGNWEERNGELGTGRVGRTAENFPHSPHSPDTPPLP
ncbi:MAG: hypothetical protein F6J93_07145 [Oscillatoria sp. SIO1A7]|nr:hypothetical protein [Oscillatoria sp. SIO1A7]